MNKAKEYRDECKLDFEENEVARLETMNHKTLEDVRELAEKKQEVMRLKGRGLYKVIELENLYKIIKILKL